MQKIDVVQHILRNTHHGFFVNDDGGYAWAPSNLALCKYWGKRNEELHLPVTSSLSISLGSRGAFTHIRQQGGEDVYILNGTTIAQTSKFAQRLKNFLNLFRIKNRFCHVEVTTNVPVAAGLASSACGFASIVQALNNLYDWRLSKTDLSILARLGSGSACRSLWEGFVEWHAGSDSNGMDSYGEQLNYFWPELRIATLLFSAQEKFMSSTMAMQQTVETSQLYQAWPQQVERDLKQLKQALKNDDFILLGETAESNSLAMHATMKDAQPSIVYDLPETTAVKQKIWELRKAGNNIFFTQDAGPNLQLLFLAADEKIVINNFSDTEIILPFADSFAEKIVLVDNSDNETGSGEKFAVHLQGKSHRAFSVFILRKKQNRFELLMQQRSANKYHSANLWTNTCCGHPRPGEDIINAAKRRLNEEMGLIADLKEIAPFHYQAEFKDVGLIENEFDHVLVGFLSDDNIHPNTNEVQNYAWVDIKKLQADLASNPQKYTAWLRPALDLLMQHLYK